LCDLLESASLAFAGAAFFGALARGSRLYGAAPNATKIMIYALAALSLMFVSYLVHDFYHEQLRAVLIPVRSNRKSADRQARRNRAE